MHSHCLLQTDNESGSEIFNQHFKVSVSASTAWVAGDAIYQWLQQVLSAGSRLRWLPNFAATFPARTTNHILHTMMHHREDLHQTVLRILVI
jgi:hypothetical protein